MKKIFFYFLVLVTAFGFSFVEASESRVNVILFERDDCQHCINEKAFFETVIDDSFVVIEKDITDYNTRKEFEAIAQKYAIPLATPITLVGDAVFSGFDTAETTGKNILEKIEDAKRAGHFNFTIEQYLGSAQKISVDSGSSVCDDSEDEVCEVDFGASTIQVATQEKFTFWGKEIDIKNMGLFSMASILGVIDGFNPCAMWVLLTFLVALSQIGNRRRMAQIVGLFIVAEAVMYFMILNIWYQVWDFVKLDAIVTPAIGVFSIGAGLYFLYKWYKTKDVLVCDVTNAEHQMKITTKIQNIAKKPFTFGVVITVLLIAFSVNIIEFACSIGIAQTFTKVLEINNLSFLMQQFYIMVYTIGYMIDDFIVFGLALWGYKKFYTVGAKYSKHSTIIAGVLMITLGVVLVFFRELLIL